MKTRDTKDLVTTKKVSPITEKKDFPFGMKTQMATTHPPNPYTQRKVKANAKLVYGNTGQTGGKRLACCITGSQSRLANDDGTWLCCRSLACLRGVTDGGGTPDVEADRPSLQLTFGSVDKVERKTVS